MATAPEILIDQATRHQVFLERLKTGEANKYAAFLREIDDSIRSRLAGRDITAFTRNRLQKMLESVESDIKTINSGWLRTLRSDVREIAEYEADFEVRSLGKVIKAEFNIPTAGQLAEAVNTNPLSVEGPDRGKLLDTFMREWTGKTSDRVSGAISAGYYQGQTTNQILQTIRGTRAQSFTDGLLAISNKDASLMTRTALQHSATQAREQVWRANSDIVKKVRWVSTLDSRTSQICQSLDGQEYQQDKGPRPPIHIGCRSTVVAVLDDRFAFLDEGATRSARGPGGVESVDAKETYYSWLKKQPQQFQEAAIGAQRARLLRDGGLSAERFAELQLGKTFEPLTLAEMRNLDPLAFERAGI
jgi:SPP1 gp7 family putative phage head morphogenesis protein